MGDGPLTKAELDETTREWREDLARRGHSVDASKQPVAKGLPAAVGLSARDKGLLQGVAESIAPYLKRIEQLEQRVAELETVSLRYVGVWQLSASYQRGNVVTHDGSAFHCVRAVTGERPGTGNSFQLMIKHGKDAVVPRSDAATANSRVNGHYSRPRP